MASLSDYIARGSRAWNEKVPPASTPKDMYEAQQAVVDEFRRRLKKEQAEEARKTAEAEEQKQRMLAAETGNSSGGGMGGGLGNIAVFGAQGGYYTTGLGTIYPWEHSQLAEKLNAPTPDRTDEILKAIAALTSDRTDEILKAIAALTSEVADLRAEVQRLREGQVPEFTRLSDAYADEN